MKQVDNRLLAVLNCMSDAVISTDSDGHITLMNAPAESITLCKTEDAAGRNVKDIITVQSGDAKLRNISLDNIIQDKPGISRARCILFRRDNSPVDVELSTAPITDEKDIINGVVIVIRDILDKTAKEKELEAYREQYRSLASRLAMLEENEKRRIASELHDSVGQTLALSKIKLGQLGSSASSPEQNGIIREIVQLIEQSIKETRSLTFELSPPMLYELGLHQAVQWLVEQFHEKYDLNISLNYDGHDTAFDITVRFLLFQGIRELLLNIVKHASATEVAIAVSGSSGGILISIEDNGIGFKGSAFDYEGFGLFNLRERLNHIHGTFNIESKPGRGTKVTLYAPFEANAKLQEKELI